MMNGAKGQNYTRVRRSVVPVSVIYVDSAATGDDDGSTWANAFADLQDGIAAWAAGKEIWVAGAPTTGKTYKPDGADPGNRALYFSPPDGCQIFGGFAGTETARAQRDPAVNLTILSGDIGEAETDRSYHVFGWLADADCLVDGFRIEKGRADSVDPANGGGGGFAAYGSGMRFSNCLISECHALSGGAGAIVDIGKVYLHNTKVANCSAVSNGGAIYHQDGEVVTSNCLFDSNGTIAGSGGAIYAKTVTDHKSVFCANAADLGNGGAVYLASPGEFNNSIFVENSAADCPAYGGIDTTVFNRCTAQGNTATGGVVAYGKWYNSILYGNTYALVTSLSGYAEYSDIEGGDGAGGEFGENDSHDNISSDPLYVDDTDAIGADLLWWTGDDGLRLGAGSPCLTASSTGGEIGAYAP